MHPKVRNTLTLFMVLGLGIFGLATILWLAEMTP